MEAVFLNKRILIGVAGLVIALIGVFGANVYVRKSLQEREDNSHKSKKSAWRYRGCCEIIILLEQLNCARKPLVCGTTVSLCPSTPEQYL